MRLGLISSRTRGLSLIASVVSALVVPTLSGGAYGADGVSRYVVAGDAIVSPLDGLSGDPRRGRAIVLDRAVGNCLICHRVPVPEEPFQGELGPDLAGVARRLDRGQIRLRVVDARRLDPSSLMPPYHRVGGRLRVAPEFKGRPVLTAQQVEDVVAWLASLDP